MVKLDGLRVDPARLESLLRQHREVQAAAVRVQSDGEEPYLMAWVVRRTEPKSLKAPLSRQVSKVSEEQLLRYVSERLTAGLVPRRIVIAERLPQSEAEWLLEPTSDSQ